MILVLLVAAALVALWYVLDLHARRAPLMQDQPSRLDTLDGARPACWSTGPRGGHAYRRNDAGTWVCRCCGDVRGLAVGRDLSNRELRELHDERRRLTGETA